MAGLGSVNDNKGKFLSIAGGYIWDRKADESSADFATQTFKRADGTEGVRKGARYADLSGMVKKVEFKTHPEYGENINMTVEADGELFIVSISTNNRYSQDTMKALLKMDLSKPIFMKPYDFTDRESNKRVMGISFRQDGEKVNLRNDDAPMKDGDWFKTASKKDIRRFFEDLTEWYVGEVEEKVCSQFLDVEEEKVETQKEEPVKKAPVKTEEPVKKVTPLKMRKALKLYIQENYEDKELPKLSKEDLVKWYNLTLEDEELPFEEDGEVSEEELDSQLQSLMK